MSLERRLVVDDLINCVISAWSASAVHGAAHCLLHLQREWQRDRDARVALDVMGHSEAEIVRMVEEARG